MGVWKRSKGCSSRGDLWQKFGRVVTGRAEIVVESKYRSCELLFLFHCLIKLDRQPLIAIFLVAGDTVPRFETGDHQVRNPTAPINTEKLKNHSSFVSLQCLVLVQPVGPAVGFSVSVAKEAARSENRSSSSVTTQLPTCPPVPCRSSGLPIAPEMCCGTLN